MGVREAFDANERVCLCASGSLVKHSSHVGFVAFLLFVSYYKTYKSTQTLMFSLKFLHAVVPLSTDAAVPVHLTPFSLLLKILLETVTVVKTVRNRVHVRNGRYRLKGITIVYFSLQLKRL